MFLPERPEINAQFMRVSALGSAEDEPTGFLSDPVDLVVPLAVKHSPPHKVT